ncbi:lipoprotein [Streptomyces sp. NPDC093546]|uniref:lipoprotein n=1 Tax=Streptomyces sp. NPDC093546 TaxID=3366040 RepID=UPI00381E1D19
MRVRSNGLWVGIFMGRYVARGAVPAVVVAAGLLLSGCSSEPEKPGKPAGEKAQASASASPSKAASADAAPGAAVKGATLGGAGSPCALPVSFDTAQDWVAKKVTAPEDPDLAELIRQGPVTMACEVDAKPAGHLGFLRVWTGTGKGGSPRQALEAFVTADKGASEARYTEIKAGALPATEVTYTYTSDLLDESKPERAFAVTTPSGPVVVHLGGLDAAEHQAMLPAYDLAKKSVALNG